MILIISLLKRQALKQTEDVVIERIALVKELDILRFGPFSLMKMNFLYSLCFFLILIYRQTVKFLQDERDELRIQVLPFIKRSS